MAIPTYIINLTSRGDRKAHIEKEFAGRNEFNISIIEACEHKVGAIGLWESLKQIVCLASDNNLSYFLLCEDDHQFTENYNAGLFNRCIEEAVKRDSDILCGGVSWFEDGFSISNNLFWVRKFSGLQFTIVFKKLYARILNSDFNQHDAADYKISGLASRKYFIHPFISTQKEFGYSDVTTQNDGTKRVEELFKTTDDNARIIKRIESFYKNIGEKSLIDNDPIDFETITIPTYVINLSEGTERRNYIIDQFNGKKEFDVSIVDSCKHTIGAVGLWQCIRKIVNMAINNDDDVIIICKDDHEFTPDYRKEFLLKNIIQAHKQGCDYLTCGPGKFDFAIPISSNRFWVNHCLYIQFIVLYHKFFQQITNEPDDNTVIADLKLSELTRHKMILYPFISLPRDFQHSDVSLVSDNLKNEFPIKKEFEISANKLKHIIDAKNNFGKYRLNFER